MIEVHRYAMVTIDLFREWQDQLEEPAGNARFEWIEDAGLAEALCNAGVPLHCDYAGRVFVRMDTLLPI